MSKISQISQARELFVAGKDISTIASLLGLSRQTIHSYKSVAKNDGDDWDEAALIKKRDLSVIKADENRFLNTLISNFDAALKELESAQPVAKLEALNKFATLYYKLKTPLATDTKSIIARSAAESISAIADIAKEKSNLAVSDFLSANADEILKRVLNA